MKLHRNAKSTPSSRFLLVRRVLFEQWTYAETAEGFGVSVRTVAKWVRRFREGGVAALEDASSRPGAPPHQTPPAAVALIRVLRQQHGLPAWAIGRALHIPRSTVGAWLRRLGLSRPAPTPAVPIQRYEWPQPGDLLHVDIKPLGGIHGVGHRIHGNRQRRGRGIGWEYVHVAVDDHSRVAYVEVLANQLGPSCAAFLRRALAWFATRGVSVRRVMTDNGSNYLSHVFRGACEELGLRHIRTRVYTPRTNGKAERFIQTLLREWAYAEPYESSRERRAKLRPYLRFYNRHRPHASLDYQAPWSRLTSAA
jgi:transposase InsO family protein